MTKHIGSFLLSHELLSQALHLPDDTTILGVLDHDRHTCRVLVTHPDLPARGQVTELKLRFHTTYHEPAIIFTEQIANTELKDWGIEETE